MINTNAPFDRKLLRERRNRVAHNIKNHDHLLKFISKDLVERLQYIKRNFKTCLNLGSHHGLLGRLIKNEQHIETLIQLDSSTSMIKHSKGLKIVADEEILPFKNKSIDLIVSGLALNSINDLPGTLAQIRNILKPDGLFLASMLGGTTLNELRYSFTHAEINLLNKASPRIFPFSEIKDLGALLQRAAFALPVVDSTILKIKYDSVKSIMHDLRGMGATNVIVERDKKPINRKLLDEIEQIYKKKFSVNKKIFASFEILTLTGWAPHASQQKPLKPGSATHNLRDFLGANKK